MKTLRSRAQRRRRNPADRPCGEGGRSRGSAMDGWSSSWEPGGPHAGLLGAFVLVPGRSLPSRCFPKGPLRWANQRAWDMGCTTKYDSTSSSGSGMESPGVECTLHLTGFLHPTPYTPWPARSKGANATPQRPVTEGHQKFRWGHLVLEYMQRTLMKTRRTPEGLFGPRIAHTVVPVRLHHPLLVPCRRKSSSLAGNCWDLHRAGQ